MSKSNSVQKSEISKQYEYKSVTVFLAASIALTAGSVLTYMSSVMSELSVTGSMILQIFTVVFMICAYVLTIVGFSAVNRSCKTAESQENYYLGRNLMIMAIASIVLTFILEFAVLMLYMLLNNYADAQSLTAADISAYNNLKIITAIVLIIVNIAAISTPYIVYLWHMYKSAPKGDKTSNLALLAMLVMLVHLAIAVLNSVYSINGGETSFLSSFSQLVMVIKYVVLMLYFVKRRMSITSSQPKEETE